MNPMKRFSGERNKVSSNLLPVILILCMFAAVISIGIRQLSENKGHIHEETLSNLDLNAQVIGQKINDMYVSLEAAAPQMAFEAGFTQKQMLFSMAALRNACGFDFVVRTDATGMAFNYLGKENIDLSGRQYIRDALQGKRTCEYINSGTYDPQSAYVILAVPVPYQNTVVGVLHGSYKVSNFDRMLSQFANDGPSPGSGTFIAAADGTVIGASDRSLDCSPFVQVLLHKSEEDRTAEQAAAENLNAGKSGYLTLTANGRKQYYYYEPITDVECCQWVMIKVADQASVTEHTGMLTLGIILLCATAVCITAALIYSVIRRQRLVVLQGEEAQTLSKALEDAKRANRAKSDFLSRMSHDIRTPLNGIIGMTYLAKAENDPEKIRDNLNKIDTSSKFLLGLINDVLDMSKAESGKIELHLEPYPPSEFASYMEAVIKPLVVEKNQTIDYQIHMPENVIPLQDKLRINQIVFNILSNAVKFTPEGGKIKYTASGKMISDSRMQMHIEVVDNGVGMSEEFQKVIFDPFSQEGRNDNSAQRGTGLGMAITKRLVDRMGGTIRVESQIGRGSTFFVDISFETVPADAATDACLVAAETSDRDDSVLEGKHILLCEDHPLNQEIAKTLLEEKHVIVSTAEDGKIGMEMFRDSLPNYYDAVLMDIRMPVMDGYEAARSIRAMNRADAKTVPIIAMTADAFSDDVQKCLDVGMDGHISKPIDPLNMYQAIGRMIIRRKNNS